MLEHRHLQLRPFPRGFHLVTEEILAGIGPLPQSGLFHLFIQHTSAGLTLNENYDPTVRADFNSAFDRLVPENEPYYTHTLEGPDDMPAHIKSALVGSSLSIPIEGGQLALGTWQGIYLCEFRNRAGGRKLLASLLY